MFVSSRIIYFKSTFVLVVVWCNKDDKTTSISNEFIFLLIPNWILYLLSYMPEW